MRTSQLLNQAKSRGSIIFFVAFLALNFLPVIQISEAASLIDQLVQGNSQESVVLETDHQTQISRFYHQHPSKGTFLYFLSLFSWLPIAASIYIGLTFTLKWERWAPFIIMSCLTVFYFNHVNTLKVLGYILE